MSCKKFVLPLTVILAMVIYCRPAAAYQSLEGDDPQITARKATQEIKVDGELTEADWLNNPSTSEFLNKWPTDTGLAVNQTKAWVLYDEEYLYIAAINYQKKDRLVVKSLKRDNGDYHWSSDGFSVVLDPFNQKTNGFIFGVNAGGARIDGMVSVENSNTRPDLNWDNVWLSSVKTHEDYWVAEIAIPFKSLNYDPESDNWGINFIRNDMNRNEYSTWRRVPLGFPGIDIGHLGVLRLEQTPPPRGKEMVLQPYVAGSANRDYNSAADGSLDADIGLDAKIPLGSSLKLDLTLNPDFSTVDVDRQVTNLTRFSIFFPEKRTFFLENSDLFTSFGTWGLKPFFSRRIGLENGDLIPILFGARVTGNLNSQLRTGFMNVHTNGFESAGPNNYTVAAVQQQLFGRSNIKALITNRTGYNGFNSDGSDFNRTVGAEFNYVSDNSLLRGNLRYHWSRTPEAYDDASFAGATLMYNNGDIYWGVTGDRVGDNYINELGFSSRSFHYDAESDSLMRVGFQFLNPWAGINFRPESDWINTHELSAWTVMSWENNGQPIDRTTSFSYSLRTYRHGSIRASFRNNRVRLLFPTNLIGGDEYLPARTYTYNRVQMSYDSDERGIINWGLNGSAGQFYNGQRTEFGGYLNFRTQPWGNFGVRYVGNKVTLPEQYGETLLHLVGPQAEISFTNTLSWSTFLQFNTQAENFNLNSRLQWRFAAMSDLYLVYNDNYDTDGLRPQTRGLVFKINYWIN